MFQDREDAGRQLAQRLAGYANRDALLVLALPRGGVPVAYPVAEALDAPLDVIVVRKLGAPGQPELAMGAIALGGVQVTNPEVVRALSIPPETVAKVARRERVELRRREEAYRGARPFPELTGRTVILVDDGVATGATLRAAARAVRELHPAELVLAVPHGAPDSIASLEPEADRVVCLATPTPYLAVGAWYRDFGQTSDGEVRELLARAAVEHAA